VPISYYAEEVIIGKKWGDKDIQRDICKVIEEKDISLCLPLFDDAIPIIAGLPLDYRNIAISCDEITARNCLDKQKFADVIFGSNLSYLYPSAQTDEYPKISKLRKGCSSRDMYVIKCKHSDAGSYHGNDRVVQKYIENATEFTVDFYIDKNQNFVGACPRQRIVVAGGEVQIAKTVYDDELIEITEKLCQLFRGFRGPGAFQFLKHNITGELFAIECNPRFNGGSPLAIFSGFNMIDMLCREYLEHKELNRENYKWKDGIEMQRSYLEHYFKNGKSF
jgi:carbamoylphosphate synthase large subunit